MPPWLMATFASLSEEWIPALFLQASICRRPSAMVNLDFIVLEEYSDICRLVVARDVQDYLMLSKGAYAGWPGDNDDYIHCLRSAHQVQFILLYSVQILS